MAPFKFFPFSKNEKENIFQELRADHKLAEQAEGDTRKYIPANVLRQLEKY